MLLFTTLAALALVLPPPAFPALWGERGHRLVARLAWERLTPSARSVVTSLLEEEGFVDASIWADQVRPDRPETAPLHYVNLPITGPGWDPARCPEGRCVVGAITRYRAVLADRTRPQLERTEALRFLVHLVGDLHQPLHVGDNGDRGGNDVPVTWEGRSTNLHSVWDSSILGQTGESEDRHFLRLAGRTVDLAATGAGTELEWAAESHTLARLVGYGALPADRELAGSYGRAALPVAEERIVQAGVRLARLLNAALGGG